MSFIRKWRVFFGLAAVVVVLVAILLRSGVNETTDGELAAEPIEEEAMVLPAFIYSGADPAIGAIWESMQEDAALYQGDVIIPGYVIYKEAEVDGEYLVFGNFWLYGYQLNENILEVSSGGEMPACFHLKETKSGYEVLWVEKAGDGADYSRDIQEFTRNYPGLYEMYQNNTETRQEAMKEYLRMYIQNNDLNIRYFKEYGWDPVEI